MKNFNFNLSLPNDYDSEADDALAMAQAYGENAADFAGDSDAANKMYEPIAEAAIAAGLKYVEKSAYGAAWEGTEAQFAACIMALPKWAQALRQQDR